MPHAHTTEKMSHVHVHNDNEKEKEHLAKHMLKVCKRTQNETKQQAHTSEGKCRSDT